MGTSQSASPRSLLKVEEEEEEEEEEQESRHTTLPFFPPPPSPLDLSSNNTSPNHSEEEEAVPKKTPSPTPPSIPIPITVSSSLSPPSHRTNNHTQTTSSSFSPFRVIGLGTCGTVFESLDAPRLVCKKASDPVALRNDFRLTNAVHHAIRRTQDVLPRHHSALFPTPLASAFASVAATTTAVLAPHCSIPRAPLCHEFLRADGDAQERSWWSANMPRFPEPHRGDAEGRGSVFLADRIAPVPRCAREALIRMYFEYGEEAQRAAMRDEENAHCLIRVYLGEREAPDRHLDPYDSLHNFPLRLNMMEDDGVRLDTAMLAAEMAVGLAVVHWDAQVDAMDAEFVLGTTASAVPHEEALAGYAEDAGRHEVEFLGLDRRFIHLWMLDFDKASSIELTSNDVDTKLVPAFLGNDPYYPRPDVDEDLWKQFCGTYLKASKLILENRSESGALHLPQRFLDKVVEKIKQHEDWDPEEQIEFAY